MNPSILGLPSSTPLSIGTVTLNLVLTMLLSLTLGWHFARYGSSFSNRARFARVLPPVALTTALVISVVKASLALSLGLVGALSIVRFRTPVKEPEEQAYQFIAVANGAWAAGAGGSMDSGPRRTADRAPAVAAMAGAMV